MSGVSVVGTRIFAKPDSEGITLMQSWAKDGSPAVKARSCDNPLNWRTVFMVYGTFIDGPEDRLKASHQIAEDSTDDEEHEIMFGLRH